MRLFDWNENNNMSKRMVEIMTNFRYMCNDKDIIRQQLPDLFFFFPILQTTDVDIELSTDIVSLNNRLPNATQV